MIALRSDNAMNETAFIQFLTRSTSQTRFLVRNLGIGKEIEDSSNFWNQEFH